MGLISARWECLFLYPVDLEIAPLKNTVISQCSFSLTTTQTLLFDLRASASLSAPHLLRPTLIQQQAKPPCLCCITRLPGGVSGKGFFCFKAVPETTAVTGPDPAQSHTYTSGVQQNSHQRYLEGKGKWLFKTK